MSIKTKVMTVVGTRPEIIRLSRVLSVLDDNLDHTLVHTGQNYDYELNKIFFDELGLRTPDYFLEAAEASAACTIARIIERFDALLDKETPDAILILGDTNSCLAAIPAKRRKIPIFHMEAGNRCFDQRVPEEINRKIVDHIADINMPYSDIAREYLLREGLPADRIIKTGSPMYEVLSYYSKQIGESTVLSRLKLREQEYFVVSCHREENVDSDVNLKNFVDSLNALVQSYSYPVIMSAHPRTRKRLEASGMHLDPHITVAKPLGFFDYVKLQQHSALVLSDSGTINEESSILNFPALNIREAHERPEGMEEGAVIMSGLRPDRMLEAARIAIKQSRGEDRQFRLVTDYAMPNVSQKVLRIILSYIDYVNTVVWKKR
jgi:UDP-N-acetylglucosamine 2-epimerase (non-hydrolysing)